MGRTTVINLFHFSAFFFAGIFLIRKVTFIFLLMDLTDSFNVLQPFKKLVKTINIQRFFSPERRNWYR